MGRNPVRVELWIHVMAPRKQNSWGHELNEPVSGGPGDQGAIRVGDPVHGLEIHRRFGQDREGEPGASPAACRIGRYVRSAAWEGGTCFEASRIFRYTPPAAAARPSTTQTTVSRTATRPSRTVARSSTTTTRPSTATTNATTSSTTCSNTTNSAATSPVTTNAVTTNSETKSAAENSTASACTSPGTFNSETKCPCPHCHTLEGGCPALGEGRPFHRYDNSASRMERDHARRRSELF